MFLFEKKNLHLSKMKIFNISKKSLYIFYEIKFTSCVDYCLKLTRFFSVKIHVFRLKLFDMLKNEIIKKQTKSTKF